MWYQTEPVAVTTDEKVRVRVENHSVQSVGESLSAVAERRVERHLAGLAVRATDTLESMRSTLEGYSFTL